MKTETIETKEALLGSYKLPDLEHWRAVINWELRETPKGLEFAAQGEIDWRKASGERWHTSSGGQCLDDILAIYPHNKKLQRIHAIWKQWHLNGMRAGCQHQRAENWTHCSGHYIKTKYGSSGHYYCTDENLTDEQTMKCIGNVKPLGMPCPTCGYKYGTAWLHEEIPADVLEEIKSW